MILRLMCEGATLSLPIAPSSWLVGSAGYVIGPCCCCCCCCCSRAAVAAASVVGTAVDVVVVVVVDISLMCCCCCCAVGVDRGGGMSTKVFVYPAEQKNKRKNDPLVRLEHLNNKNNVHRNTYVL